MLILAQKSYFLGPTIFEILQPNWYLIAIRFSISRWNSDEKTQVGAGSNIFLAINKENGSVLNRDPVHKLGIILLVTYFTVLFSKSLHSSPSSISKMSF